MNKLEQYLAATAAKTKEEQRFRVETCRCIYAFAPDEECASWLSQAFAIWTLPS